MKTKFDCKFAKSYDEKCIKCKRDNSLRNLDKGSCNNCPHYKRKLFGLI